jgi:NitT/TauT family transport system permease protein
MNEQEIPSASGLRPAVVDADEARRRRRRRRNIQTVLESLAAPVLALALLATWQLGVPLLGLSVFILPTPAQIIERIGSDFHLLATNSLVTLLETLVGFLIAAITGIATAFAIFYSRIFERAVYPLLVAMQTVPKVALAPLLVLYLGYDFSPKCFLAFLLAYFPIVVATVVGLQALEKPMVDVVRSMGANEWQTFVKIRLPAALPNIFGGLKVGISLAVIGAVIGEYVAAERGLGYLQLQASSQFDTTLSFASLIIISLLGVITFWAIEFLERRVVFRREAAK